ncbi:tripartite tricarboxylate transporter substrate binding protein [Pseudoroseomonas wenyumeiae]|uniref:Tripartite tricarboxylate transporter substrate binding protein n=1 Tax=Teichococcus wenyumeiae TaxID=2478470 RepID=A0A3A9JMZ9_9PROT|nr:tripartite tricarboxylate transporter substrate-binding protein [Pseudoroseomonas wenyumeiae]RKK05216.1 tripartite tricarboxylate transporter substrate binding protein [Pseudoroseomonas wenyumeiae]RMI17601.1 tripartite tricarboxylate transporter substrate binding protein [Pseudoroseomonas wenyumeiae]
MSSKLTRRVLLGTMPFIMPRARAQEAFPSRPITIMNAYAAGGQTDIAIRLTADRLGATIGQRVVVENRVGGATSIASTAVAQAKPDGYMLLAGTSSLAINPTLQPKLTPRDPQTELMPLGMIYRGAFVFHIYPGLPVRTLPEFVACAKAHPGQLNYGGVVGTVVHLAMEMLCQRAVIQMTAVPNRGGVEGLLDLQAGRIHCNFQSPVEALPSLQEGKTRALAISSRARLPNLPDVPTVAETLPGFEAVLWMALFAPVHTPVEVVQKLALALRAVTEDPAYQSRMAQIGLAAEAGGPSDVRNLLAADTANWRKVITEAGLPTN